MSERIEHFCRAKRLDTKELIEGYYCKKYVSDKSPTCRDAIMFQTKYDPSKWTPEYMTVEIDPSTIGWFTGLIDKNGKKIFTTDILNFKTTAYFFENCRVVYEIKYARFCVVSTTGNVYPMDESFEYEVIGDVFDGSDSLTGDDDLCR